MRIGITGANGYVGQALAQAAIADGHEPIALSRRPADGLSWRRYDLAESVSPDLVEGLDAIVHAAYDLRVTDPEEVERINVLGTRNLVAAAGARAVPLILISSMSAYEGTRQIYGRAKLASEADVQAAGGDALRLGLVYGGDGGGMIGSLERAARLPVVPLVAARSWQFAVHIDDMARAVLAFVTRRAPSGSVVGVAHPRPVPFASLMRGLAGAQRRRTLFVPIPWRPVYAAMRAVEIAGGRLPVRADSLLGLGRPAPSVPRQGVWADLGVELRAYAG